jgi:hypothetical protein
MHKYTKKVYAIKTIALNEKELEKAFKEKSSNTSIRGLKKTLLN